jgi:mannosyltransferase OCH1-like enzyme
VPCGCRPLIIFYFSGWSSFKDGLEENISYQLPQFPRKIWQIWKVDPLAFEDRDLSLARTWIEKNPSYRYEVLTDSNDLSYVETHFGPTRLNRPDIVHV